ncbi:MAG: ABC transporter substrate-binding protein [Caldilineaceae bacterium]
MNHQEQPTVSRRRFIQLSALAGVGLAAVACAPAVGPETTTGSSAAPVTTGPQAGGILRYAETGEFNHFSPWQMANVNMGMYNQVFGRLIWKDDEGNEHGDMAESWEMAEDGLSFTVKMYENIQWHDGKPCTADDIVNMYLYTKDETLLQDTAVTKTANLMKSVIDVKALDPYTVQFVFDTPVPYITEILDYFWAIRIDDKADPAFMQTLPVGTGPFKIVEWAPNQYTKYVRHEAYHHEGLPYLDEWHFNRLEKSETLIPNLEAEGVDGIFGPPLSDIERLQQDDRYWVEVSNAAGSIFNIIVNTHLPPLDKKEVRQALSYSLNREAMVKSAFFGIATPITSPFWNPTSLAYREDLVMAHAFDLDKAAELLAQAGVSDLTLDINVTSRWPQMKLFTLIWQADLAKIGVTLNVQEVEIGKFYEIGGDGNLLGIGLHPWLNGRTSRDPAIFLSTQTNYRGDTTMNRYGWENAELEQIIADGAVELDLEARRPLYQRANEILVDELPMIQVATDPRVWVWAKKVQGPHIDLVGNITLDQTWLADS